MEMQRPASFAYSSCAPPVSSSSQGVDFGSATAKMAPLPCYVTPAAPALSSRNSAFASSRTLCGAHAPKPATPTRRQRAALSMGLFGLGLPEVAVIAGIGILIFGPSKIASMGKDLGSVAGSVKKASAEFQEAMSESLAEADREIEQNKQKKGTVVEAKQIVPDETVPMKKVEVMDE
jgi:sec-independent protein translocase protein TatA